MISNSSRLVFALATLSFGSLSFGQYTATLLHPAGAIYSSASAAGGGIQGGIINGSITGNAYHAAIWTGSAASVVDLNPAGYSLSWINGASSNSQVGYGHLSSTPGARALKWEGTAGSVVDLHPLSGFSESEARGASTISQVGVGAGPSTGMLNHALLWFGTASSAVDLHPSGYQTSQANAASDAVQVGNVKLNAGTLNHAALWTGSAGSFVDMHPSGYDTSDITATNGAFHGGYGVLPGGANHALLWSGSSNTPVNLHPAGYAHSYLQGMNGTLQVGSGVIGSTPHAMAWAGTAGSAIDLHGLAAGLPVSLVRSMAMDIDSLGNISGFGQDAGGNTYALLWAPNAVPEPGTMIALTVGGLALLRRRRK